MFDACIFNANFHCCNYYIFKYKYDPILDSFMYHNNNNSIFLLSRSADGVLSTNCWQMPFTIMFYLLVNMLLATAGHVLSIYVSVYSYVAYFPYSVRVNTIRARFIAHSNFCIHNKQNIKKRSYVTTSEKYYII